MDEHVKFINERLEQNGKQSYIVGGYVRDLFLGIKSNDIDIATDATPDELKSIFYDQNIRLVGDSFPVCLVNGIEVATYRKDHHDGIGDENCTTTCTKTIEEDLWRRDTTCNAIAMSLKGEFIDPTGGIDDINNRILRFVGNPEDRILQDPNRIVRFLRFGAKLNFHYDPYSWGSCKRYNHLVRTHVKSDRIKEEILKLMKLPDPRRFFYDAHNVKILRWIFAPLDWCWDLDGGPYHAETVFDHCVDTGYYVSRNHPLIRWAATIHDCGKFPAAFIKDEDGLLHFYNHEKMLDDINNWLRHLRFSTKDIKIVNGLIETHMKFDPNVSKRSARSVLAKLRNYDVHYRDWVRIGIADRKANRNGGTDFPFTRHEIVKVINTLESILEGEGYVNNQRNLKISGKMIMDIFNLTPGKEVGIIKNYLCNVVQEGECLNTEESLLNYIDANYNELKGLIND